MNIFHVDKVLDRLDQMIENAIAGNPIESQFDETKMSALETKLQKYLEMNGRSSRQLFEEKVRINELISDISHQTKTPIANILLYTQLLQESNLSEQDRKCLLALAEQTEKLNFLISSLVKASRLETGIIALSPRKQLIQPLIDEVVEQLKLKAERKHILFNICRTKVVAIFDRKWTVEALYNIVDNAVKYTNENGIISISVIPYQMFCRIDISDNGIGIIKEEITKIFSRFYRSEDVSEYEGVGIGLYLAREILSEEKGYIKVSSVYGSGSTFSVFLPME